jgi:hypothetical protein
MPAVTSNRSEKSGHPIARIWAVITGSLAFIAALSKALDAVPRVFLERRYLWIGHFLPDFLVISIIFGLLPWFLAERHITITGSIAHLVRTQKGFQRYAILALVFVVLALLQPLWGAAKLFYDARYQSAQMDWHFIEAKVAMRSRRYDQARRQLVLQGHHLYFDEFGKSFEAYIPVMRAEMDHRTGDAVKLIERFSERVQSGPLVFDELLLVERAAALDPTAPGLREAFTRARDIVGTTLSAYLNGVEMLQQKQFGRAQQDFGEVRRKCKNILHAEVLSRFASNPDGTFDQAESPTIQYYIHTTRSEIERMIREQPEIAFLLQDIGHAEAIRVPQFFLNKPGDRSDRY